MRYLFMLFSLFFSIANASTEDLYSFQNKKLQQRFLSLTQEVRCVVCQNQSVADSNAPIANDIRHKIYLMLNENQSDAAIKAYLVARYGEFILLKPNLSQQTFVLWAFPFVSLIIMLWMVLTSAKARIFKA